MLSFSVYRVSVVWGLAVIGVLAVSTGRADELRASPHFTGDSLPVPPKQKEAWTPPASNLPPKLIDATTTLFQQGVADPRGLEYREIELVVGSVGIGDAGIVKAHGWVLPEAAGTHQHFAIAWNGLVYPAVSIGKKANLNADVDNIAKAIESIQAPVSADEKDSVSCDWPGDLRTCLLIRLGEAPAAERLWKASQAQQLRPPDDPYLSLAYDWLFARYDRAVCAHMRADDHLSAIDCAALVPLKAAVVQEGIRRKLIELDEDGKPNSSYLPNFLDALPQLLADEQRRLAEPPRKLALDSGRGAFKTKKEWIAALIRDLDQISENQWPMGGIDLVDDPVAAALAACGDDAVEPLIDCFENDTRLTRSVDFGNGSGEYRSLISVQKAAQAALFKLLQDSFFESQSLGNRTWNDANTRRVIGEQMRAFWSAYRGLSLPERWYRILKDDKEQPERWAYTATNITGIDFHPPGPTYSVTWDVVPEQKPDEPPKLDGEVLRKKVNPSVSELLIRRLRELEEMRPEGFDPNDGIARQMFENTSRVANALLAWDGKRNLPELKAYCEYLKAHAQEGWQAERMGWALIEMLPARARLGDAAAMREFAASLQSTTPKGPLDAFHLFDDAWRFPDDPVMQKCIDEMFNGNNSPWNPLIRKDHSGWFNELHLIPSPLLGFAGFRKQMLRMLADTSIAGSGTIGANGKVTFDTNLFGLNDNGFSPEDKLVPPAGTKATFRVCDVYAYHLQLDFCNGRGLPLMQLWWPLNERDKAVKRCIELLQRYGERFKYSPDHVGQPDEASMFFPKLDHPATPDDVSAGRAIFSLAGAGEKVRRHEIPWPRCWGKWITLKEHYAKENKFLRYTGYEMDGFIWQAEEVLKDGKWRRYYGFVGDHDVAQVPAEEMEVALPGSAGWSEMSHQVSCSMMTPTVDYSEPTRGVCRIRQGDPLVLATALGNRRGVMQTLPAVWFQADGKGGAALAPGVSIELLYTPKTGYQDGTVWSTDPAELRSWSVVPAKPAGAGWRLDSSTRDVEAGQAFEIMRFDLADWFDLTKPGAYRVKIVFNVNRDGFKMEGTSYPFQFTLVPRTIGSQ